jgi:phospholipid/cholesterol/gamma-HCH transport system ATP-binding protein
MAQEVVISARDVVIGFGDRLIINGLDLDVYRGEVLGVVGGSGTGKSVLTRCIIGLIPKRAGKIHVFGQDLDDADDAGHREIESRWGVLFQHGALFSSLTVKQNIQVPLREYLKLSEPLMDEIARLKIAMVGLKPDAADKYPSEACGACKGAGARPGDRLPRRADLRARSDRRRRVRHADQDVKGHVGADGVYGDPRSR